MRVSNEGVGRTAAECFRTQYSLGNSPISNLAQVIEHTVGIGVAYVRSSAPGHGMTMCLGRMYLMAVGCTEHPMRLRSTLAHELGHYQLNSVNRMADSVDWAHRSPEEIQADVFARHLLVPIQGVADMVGGREVTLANLSDIVQSYLASPAIVAIQMREAGVIDADTCKQWSQITTRALATQFGWLPDYQVLVTQSTTPRGPQRLMSRAMEGYRQGSISSSTIARLSGDPKTANTTSFLDIDRFVPVEMSDTGAPLPRDTGERLTSEELSKLMGDTE